MTDNSHDHQEFRFDSFEMNGSSRQSVADIADQLRESDPSLIALDGLPGAGKSTLATRLSALLTIRAVHLDDYLEYESIGFSDCLRYEELQRALMHRPVIVEGVCMLDVLDRLKLQSDHVIYLRAPSAERQLDRSHPLVREARAYSERALPVERANLVLTRSDSGPRIHKKWADIPSTLDGFLMKNRSRISLGLSAAGMTIFATGAIFVVIGTSAHDENLMRVGGDISLVNTGLATMLTSCLWIFLARLARPSIRVRSPKAKQ